MSEGMMSFSFITVIIYLMFKRMVYASEQIYISYTFTAVAAYVSENHYMSVGRRMWQWKRSDILFL